jgi:hypothetical protein
MPRPIDYRSSSPYTAEQVFAAMSDPEFLRARLLKLGGPGAALVEHTTADGGVRYTLRHGLDNDVLPPMMKSLVGGDVVIERTESVRPAAGGYRGEVDVRVPGAPVVADGTMALRDASGGSVFSVRAQVTVRVPLLGGRIEAVIAEQVQRLLEAETDFTRQWLSAGPQ